MMRYAERCKDRSRKIYPSHYQRVPRLLQEIAVSTQDGRYNKLIGPIIKCEVLIRDVLLISPSTTTEQRDILEIVEERYYNGTVAAFTSV